ncbi:MAG: hypothetical protein LBT05_03145 [Planctomycetaceae bacterium]|jgi:hypothetical protein|nr:hypothetical protein [Planctomycetaceae bacterium]
MQWSLIKHIFLQKHWIRLFCGSAVGVVLSGMFFSEQNVFAQQYYSSRSPQRYQTIQREAAPAVTTPVPDFWGNYRSSDGVMVLPADFQQRPRLWMTYHFSYENSYAFHKNNRKENDWSLPDISLNDSELLSPTPISLTEKIPQRTPQIPIPTVNKTDAPSLFSDEELLESTSSSNVKINVPREVRLMRTTTAPSPYVR